MLLNNIGQKWHYEFMKNLNVKLLTAVAAFAVSPVFAQAGCYADYKAKMGDPLQLHYGVIELTDDACNDPAIAQQNIQSRISVGGWQLLNVISVFQSDGLTQRQESAGTFYLIY